MKRKNLFIILLTLLFTVLFYRESSGLNYLLFTLAVIVIGFQLHPGNKSDRKLKLLALLAVISSVSVLIYGNKLASISNWISLALFATTSAYRYVSVFTSMLFAQLSFIGFPVYVIMDLVGMGPRNEDEVDHSHWPKTITMYTIPVLITMIFVTLYYGANTAFAHTLDRINIDFFTPEFFGTLVLGCIVSFIIIKPRIIDIIYQYDQHSPNMLVYSDHKSFTLFDNTWNLNDEIKSGVILFAFLNILLLFVNILDTNYLYISNSLPAGMTYSEFIHQGVGQIIMSIIFAIAIILFYFRSAINFSKKNKWITRLALLWVIQNIFMVISNIYKNQLYIHEFTLTYKRIGVYFYLGLTIIGLVLTAIKIMKLKSNYFLFRANGWTFYFSLLLASLVNWDTIITRYNISYSKSIDKSYLMNLSDANIPLLIELYNSESNKPEIQVKDWRQGSMDSSFEDYEEADFDFESQLTVKIEDFIIRKQNQGILSWNLSDELVYRRIIQLNEAHQIKVVQIDKRNDETLQILSKLNHVEKLIIKWSGPSNLNQVSAFKSIRTMIIENDGFNSLSGIENFQQLETLTLNTESVQDFSPLQKLPHLKRLYIQDDTKKKKKELDKMFPSVLVINV